MSENQAFQTAYIGDAWRASIDQLIDGYETIDELREESKRTAYSEAAKSLQLSAIRGHVSCLVALDTAGLIDTDGHREVFRQLVEEVAEHA